MKQKRWLCLTLAAAMAFSLAGCGGAAKDSADSAEDGEITLRILENDTAKSEGYLDELLDAFNEAYRDEGITAVDANMEEYSDLAENGPYGYGPDVIYQANDKLMTYAEDKHILAITKEDFEAADQIPEEAWAAFSLSVDGKTYLCGVPVNVQEPMLFYRKDLLPADWESTWDEDQNGTPDFFEDWRALYRYSEALSKDSGGTRYGLVAPCNDLYMMAGFLFSYGGYVFGENEDGTVDTADIGFAAGDTAKGLYAMRQFAGLMNEECIDDSIKQSRYAKVADGTYFCSISTPDTYVLFHDRLAEVYEGEGKSADEAEALATENIGMVELPKLLPADGDLSKEDGSTVENICMGGINGYGISAYTKHREACVKFVDFATSYEMVKKRAALLGIAPTRSDAAEEIGGVTGTIFDSLNAGRIYLMPSVKAVDQIWDPAQTLLSDVAKDAFREKKGEAAKYDSVDKLQDALENTSKNIYDAIHTLAGEERE